MTEEQGVEPLVKVTDLKKTYWLKRKPVEVLKGVSFEVRTGEMVAVLGPSGAGKSTLLHILGTLDNPSAGGVFIDGEPIFAYDTDKLAWFRNRTIGFVFQFHHLLPEFTALENTMMPALIQRVPRVQAARMAEVILEKVGLSHRLEHRPVELSGGEQQRVALARALLLKPRLLLADEPTGNLDEQTGEGVQKLLWDLNKGLSMTTIVVTHNPKLACDLGRRIILHDGKVWKDGDGDGGEGN